MLSSTGSSSHGRKHFEDIVDISGNTEDLIPKAASIFKEEVVIIPAQKIQTPVITMQQQRVEQQSTPQEVPALIVAEVDIPRQNQLASVGSFGGGWYTVLWRGIVSIWHWFVSIF